MKKIGIIGGIGPESTVDYYKLIINSFRGKQANVKYPEIIIYSADLSGLMTIVEAKDWDALTNWLIEKVNSLYKAGADFAVIGSNTPHIVFDRVRSVSPVPMLSIVEETKKYALIRNLGKLGLLGTRFTMESDFYHKSFEENRIKVIVPDKEDQELIHHRLFTEIELGIIKDSTRNELLSIVKKMISKHSIDGVILGCTELQLILDKDEFGIPFLNTTAIHVKSIVNYCIGKEFS